ncbi:hypothetical protein MD484_g6312, partial [Candolleomyces efflorescens]
MARGIPGVAQMVSYESDRGRTRDLRSFGIERPVNFQDRVETRVIVKLYGQAIDKFSSAKELLGLIRDAIEAHRQLLKKGILHRDISLHHILKGKPGAEPGHRAILIDLDLALHYTVDSTEPTDWRIGTSLYQSVMVLRSCRMAEPLVHDHLDDLESFLYVLSYIIYVYDSRGVFHSIPSPFEEWIQHENNPSLLSRVKEGSFVFQSTPVEITSRWPAPCIEVLHGFRRFIIDLMHKKDVIAVERPPDGSEFLRSLRLAADDHYGYVLGLFDKAIATLEKDEPPAASTRPPTSTLAQVSTVGQSSLKRSADDYPDAQPAAKRLNSPSSPTARRKCCHLRSPGSGTSHNA